MKHFLKAGMKPDLNAQWNVCQKPAAWRGWSNKRASEHHPVADQYFGAVFSRREPGNSRSIPCAHMSLFSIATESLTRLIWTTVQGYSAGCNYEKF